MLRALSHEPNDVEWIAANHEQIVTSNGPLQPETSNNKRKRQASCFCAPQMFGGGIYLPDPSTYDPIEILLNTHDRSERDELVKKWRDNKLSELNFVGVVVSTASICDSAPLTIVESALLAGVLTSTGSWPNILTAGKPSPWCKGDDGEDVENSSVDADSEGKRQAMIGAILVWHKGTSVKPRDLPATFPPLIVSCIT
ncbi:uncharacterized protein ALTATR162_LOCUS3646 [Alternaria atra]|uniref:Uncharacterized protein n=1 Tax=Alternaria atra TaxID=119953 RepID=A0A8J2HX44_9PLEO|nr:uncharacterized protein ALTATR162_LOCUS3646 [Alternaria atra]CAG5155405.1 unnamed protein product [Alternaria atra]